MNIFNDFQTLMRFKHTVQTFHPQESLIRSLNHSTTVKFFELLLDMSLRVPLYSFFTTLTTL